MCLIWIIIMFGTKLHLFTTYTTVTSVVLSPDQIFCVYPVTSLKKVWRLSLGKLGPVNIQKSVVVGVNLLSFGAQNLKAGYL